MNILTVGTYSEGNLLVVYEIRRHVCWRRRKGGNDGLKSMLILIVMIFSKACAVSNRPKLRYDILIAQDCKCLYWKTPDIHNNFSPNNARSCFLKPNNMSYPTTARCTKHGPPLVMDQLFLAKTFRYAWLPDPWVIETILSSSRLLLASIGFSYLSDSTITYYDTLDCLHD